MAWPPATYDVIFRNHSNRFSPNLHQNVSKGYAYSYWKQQVLMKICRGKIEGNLMGGVTSTPLPPLYARGLIYKFLPKCTPFIHLKETLDLFIIYLKDIKPKHQNIPLLLHVSLGFQWPRVTIGSKLRVVIFAKLWHPSTCIGKTLAAISFTLQCILVNL